VQYADDALLIMEVDARQLVFMKALLNNFVEIIGLKVSFSKSIMVPINIFEDKLDQLSRTFGCSKGSLPFTYLGLPLSLTKPKLDDFLPVVNKCESRLANISSSLSTENTVFGEEQR
jgi:hypothetical protein